MNEPSEGQILAALAESGFLFEQECASALEALAFHVETSWPFADPDLNKSRELDLRAIRAVYQDESTRFQVFVELLVECKDFDAPLVFLERPKNKRELDSPTPNEYRFPRAYYRHQLSNNSYREVPGFEYFGLADKHYYYREANKATQFVKIVRKGSQWTANHDGIHDALILPLAKALEARKGTFPKHAPQKDDWCSIWLFFPVVLVRNRLLIHAPGSTTSLVDRGRISYVRGLESNQLKGSYMIDFVRLESLKNYVEADVLAFADAAKDLIATKHAALRGG